MNLHDKTVTASPTSRLAILPLLIGIGLTLVLTIYPLVLASGQGKANHLAAMLAFWSMSAGYVRGVGFVPIRRIWRLLFSTGACLVSLLAALAVMVLQHGA
jgi:predicted membrane protein